MKQSVNLQRIETLLYSCYAQDMITEGERCMNTEQVTFNSFGSRMAECRRAQNLTQEELANRIGVTPQALSQYEKGTRYPDISMLSDICRILDVSSDYLLGIDMKIVSANNNEKIQNKIWSNLREGLSPLELVFGKDIVPAFFSEEYVGQISCLRERLSCEGILLPVIWVRDQLCLKPREFMVLSYQNVLYDEELENVREDTAKYMINKLGEIVQKNYAKILNVDIIKALTENLKINHPALIEGIVPEKVSYSLLTSVCKGFLEKGNSLVYLPKVIEWIENLLRNNEKLTDEQCVEVISGQIEHENNFWMVIGKRQM